jgi:integrase
MRVRAKRFQKGSVAERTRKDGSKMLVFRWLDNNNTHRSEPLGLKSQFPTHADLELALIKMRARINDPDCYKFSHVTVETVFNLYMSRHVDVHCRKLTGSVYRSLYQTHLRPVWGDYSVTQLKTLTIEDWLGALAKSDQLKNHIKRLFFSVCEYAIKCGYLDHNPVARIRQSRKRLKFPRVLSPAEFQGLVAELKEPYKTMVIVIGGLGLRVSELLGLKWGDIDWEQLTIMVQRSVSEGEVYDTKTEASHAALPLTAALAEVLLRHRGASAFQKDGDFVFSNAYGRPPWPDSILTDHLRPAATKAGIAGPIGWHTFRRTFATLLHGLGTGMAVQKELMRHSDIKVTMNVYTQGIPDDKREAIGKLGELLNKH